VNEWIDNTIKDLEYLEKLRKMETKDPANNDFHIVPISGLILGTFVRYENELKTVMEVWGKKEHQAATPRTEDEGFLRFFHLLCSLIHLEFDCSLVL